MASRNEAKAARAMERLVELAKGVEGAGEVVYLPLDLDHPKKAKEAAELFMSKESQLDILGSCVGPDRGPSACLTCVQ